MTDFLVFAKPDAVRRNLVGEIIARFERKGFVLKDIKRVRPTAAQMEKHYEEHEGKPFFNGLVSFATSGPIVLMVWRGNIAAARALIGSTKPWEASPGTIRGELGSSTPDNLVHCSDSEESARRELDMCRFVYSLGQQ
uniref:Nucleoside diphosphate kinase n=1 Tax=Marseillevirus LCMAC202 TaxID=2506606 RepID=A0A481YZH8_9VIRU|nr:MAG: nucleoside diphosphate kinase [Marseillevirus LCMAC202]